MRHAIIGGGNLGLDIKRECGRRRISASLFTRANGFNVEDTVALREVTQGPFDVIWYCVGFGSVAEARAQPAQAKRIHATMPLMIAKTASSSKRLVYFSSDYALEAHRSEYAAMKAELEESLKSFGRPNVSCMRVGALFGHHKPEQTFPGKILAAYGFNDATIRLPENMVTPTPTYWLAGTMLQNFEKLFHVERPKIHYCAPEGSVSSRDWASFILTGLRDRASWSPSHFMDEERPPMSGGIGCTFAKAPHWYEVWQAYFQRAHYVPRDKIEAFKLRLATTIEGTATLRARGNPAL